eukprot:TRINITY_DN93417_c0_g1_i4.p1 TRINITY_DN93417_c0_g1~~TRINITY_DN93417_c0_g1_i4.p1  ORF type:complete len:434 (+),score=34.86 TRINITY_DN93417_c0_g1_i4:48-1349(+)
MLPPEATRSGELELVHPGERERLVVGGVPNTQAYGGFSSSCIPPALRTLLLLLCSNFTMACMLPLVPVGIVMGFTRECSPVYVFFVNFVAIIPLAWLIGEATEVLAAKVGDVVGGLLSATFGNVVEALLCFWGLYHGHIEVVQATLVGSILSNLLLVMGSSFFAGGCYYKIQEYNVLSASTNTSLMTLSCLCLVLPTMFAYILSSEVEGEIKISRGVSGLLAALYIQYLYFQLSTHSFLFDRMNSNDNSDAVAARESDDNNNQGEESNSHEYVDPMLLTAFGAATLLAVVTVVTAVSSEFLVYSISGLVSSAGVSREFIGVVLLPIIGNAAEHYTSILVATKNKMDLSIGVAIGSSCQMALFVTPLAVLMGWVMDVPMTLNFHPFQVTTLLLSVLVVTGVLQNGHSHWLEGSMLLTAYTAIVIYKARMQAVRW